MSECEHKRLKKNYPFGRKSAPVRVCKECGNLVSGHMLLEKKRKRNKFKKKIKKNGKKQNNK